MQILGAQCANETDWVEEKQKKLSFHWLEWLTRRITAEVIRYAEKERFDYEAQTNGGPRLCSMRVFT